MKKLILIALAAVLAACGQSPKGSGREKLAGAGATFPLPYYNLAFKTYRDSVPAEVSYGGIGSDAYLTDAEMAAMPDSVIHIPTCMGAVVMAYNLPGVEKLKLTGELVADIYLGKITRWNDARIRGINPGVQLPDLEIHPVYRSDGSGTTFVFSDYLTKVSPAWKETIGAGKSLEWPAGLAAKGNPGISGTVSQTEGAVGYIGSEYAFAQHISYASLQNKAGRFIDPTLERHALHDYRSGRGGRLPDQLLYVDSAVQGTRLRQAHPRTERSPRRLARMDARQPSAGSGRQGQLRPAAATGDQQRARTTGHSYV